MRSGDKIEWWIGEGSRIVVNYDAREIANFILDETEARGIQITNLKLLKLVFFAHGTYLAQFRRKLVCEEFQAWKHGPVVQSVYYAFKDNGSGVIRNRATSINMETGEYDVITPNLDDETKVFLKFIVESYAKYDAFELSDFTHEPGTPWDRIWESFDSRARTGMRIPDNELESFFRQRLAKEYFH